MCLTLSKCLVAGNDTTAKVDKVVTKIERKLDEIVDDNVLQFCSLDQEVPTVTQHRLTFTACTACLCLT